MTAMSMVIKHFNKNGFYDFLNEVGPHRLAAQDIGLSRRKRGFDSRSESAEYFSARVTARYLDWQWFRRNGSPISQTLLKWQVKYESNYGCELLKKIKLEAKIKYQD